MSIFTSIETKQKKTSLDKMECLQKLEKRVHDILELGVTLINNRFLPLRGKLSPKVLIMQNIMEFFLKNLLKTGR